MRPVPFDAAPVPKIARTKLHHDSPPASLVPTAQQRAQGATTPAAVAALTYVARHHKLDADALATAYVALVHDVGHGAVVVKLRQRVGGVEVAHTQLSVVMNQKLELVALSGELSNAAKPTPALLGYRRASGADDALGRAFDDTNRTRPPLMAVGTRAGWQAFTAPSVVGHARARAVLYPVGDQLVPAWETEVGVRDGKKIVGFHHVFGDDGRLLARGSLVDDVAGFQYRVWADTSDPLLRPLDGPQGDYTPHPTGTPNGFVPAFVAPPLVTMDGFNSAPGGGHDPWLAPGATTTFGNNVQAYADLDAIDGLSAGDVTPDITSAGVFDRTYDVTKDPQVSKDQEKAAVTQQFFVTNWLHDYWYDSGFTEAAGNAQVDNFGRGGVAGDPLQAQGQDSSGTDNANMFTPADGESPVMQMFVFGAPPDGIRRDGTIDDHVIEHEWGHYLHHRLVQVCDSNECGGESEGWGDFDALLTTVRATDNLDGAYGLGGYVSLEFTQNAALFGIRRYPYSTDLTKSPLTFRFVQSGVPLPTGVPTSDTDFLQGADNCEVHDQGEIWAAIMWQGLVAELKQSKGASPRFSFEEGRRRYADYVVAGMIAAPSEPTFTEQRDAVLAAAAANDPQDFVALAQAYAQRGLGTGAVSHDVNSFDCSGVIEDFNVSGAFSADTATASEDQPSCDGDGILDPGETATITFTVHNVGAAALTNAVVDLTTSTPAAFFPNGSHIAVGDIPLFGSKVVTAQVGLGEPSTAITEVDVSATLSAPGTPSVAVGISLPADEDVSLQTSAEDDFEIPGLPSWTATANWQEASVDAVNHAAVVHVALAGDDTLQTPGLIVPAGGDLELSFAHKYTFTSGGDGGVLEISTDGTTFQDVSAFVNPLYDTTITGTGNPLAGRLAYSGHNPSFPAFDNVTLDLGTSFGGHTVFLRWRAGGDNTSTPSEWDVDAVQVFGISNTPFASLTPETNFCLPGARPIANAGTNFTVASGAAGALDGTASVDPDGGQLTFSWIQASGQIMALSDPTAAQPTFTAPVVTHNKLATYRLVVTDPDHRQSTPATVQVTILAPGGVDAGIDAMTDAAIDGSIVPPDGPDVVDATLPADAPSGGDAGNPETGNGGGCCSTGGGDPRSGFVLALGVMVVVLRRRKR